MVAIARAAWQQPDAPPAAYDLLYSGPCKGGLPERGAGFLVAHLAEEDVDDDVIENLAGRRTAVQDKASTSESQPAVA